MSQNINFAGPFVKNVFHTRYDAARSAKNPAYGTPFTDVVPSPLRRVNTIIQNQGLAEGFLGLNQFDGDISEGGIKLYPGQSIALDNYNGAILIGTGGSLSDFIVSESFA